MTRGRTTTRPVADAQRQIAIGQLQRQGYLHPGETRFMFWWHQGQVTARLGIHAHSDGDRLTLYTGHLQGQQTDVSLYYSYPHLGGRRAWFRCPHCARRVGVLYWGRFRKRKKSYAKPSFHPPASSGMTLAVSVWGMPQLDVRPER